MTKRFPISRARALAGLGVAFALSAFQPAAIAADPTAAELAARAESMLDAWDGDVSDGQRLEEARKLIEQSIALDPSSAHAHALEARQMVLAGTTEEGVRPSALGRAQIMLLRAATEMSPPDAMVFGWLARLDIRIQDPKTWWALKSGERADPNDPWVLYANAEYAASHGDLVEEFEFLEKAVAAGLRSRVELRTAYGTMRHSYVLRGEPAKADAAYRALVALDPKDAVLRDGHARELITYLGDFEGGERVAREALAITDSPHAHETLSLALYAQWAAAARDGRGPQVVDALYRKAQAHDPGAHMVPTCLAEWQPLEFVYAGLAQKHIHAGDMHQC